ncbi:MAG: DUF6524 family protein [Pseudomonadota bacterium]
MANRSFGFDGFIARWIVALVLVLGTFNTTQFNYYRWVTDPAGGNVPLKVLVGLVILIVLIIFARATFRSIGVVGLVLATAFFAAIVWVLIDFGLLEPGTSQVMTYILLVVTATVLAIGISWSHVRRRISGQSDVDDVDE